jgi:hypothetical protein
VSSASYHRAKASRAEMNSGETVAVMLNVKKGEQQ